jgi:hypothetical protein
MRYPTYLLQRSCRYSLPISSYRECRDLNSGTITTIGDITYIEYNPPISASSSSEKYTPTTDPKIRKRPKANLF